jgi:hypothetical protein
MFPCTNRTAGCPEVFGLNFILQHQKVGPFVCYKCPFARTRNPSYDRYGTLQGLEIHFLRDHKGNILEVYGEGKFYSHLSPLTQTTYMTKALIVFGERFYVVWEVTEGEFYCTVIYYAYLKFSGLFLPSSLWRQSGIF